MSEPTDFFTLSSPAPAGGASFVWQVPDGWQQGRGCFGGLVLAAVTRCAQAGVDAALPLRSLTATLCGPALPGEARIEVEPVRDGKHTAVRQARLVQRGEVVTLATLVFGRRRADDGDWCDVAPLELAPWRELPVAPLGPPLAPVFTPRLEYRSVGPAPFTGMGPREALGWVRFREPGPARDAALLVALADAWWPSALVPFSAPRPMATIQFMLQLVGTLDGLDPQAPLAHRAASDGAHGGYAAERRELFGEDGRLLAVNQQTFVLIR